MNKELYEEAKNYAWDLYQKEVEAKICKEASEAATKQAEKQNATSIEKNEAKVAEEKLKQSEEELKVAQENFTEERREAAEAARRMQAFSAAMKVYETLGEQVYWEQFNKNPEYITNVDNYLKENGYTTDDIEEKYDEAIENHSMAVAEYNTIINSSTDNSDSFQITESGIDIVNNSEKIYKVDETTFKKYISFVFKNMYEREPSEEELNKSYNTYIESGNNMYRVIYQMIFEWGGSSNSELYKKQLDGKTATYYKNTFCKVGYKWLIGVEPTDEVYNALLKVYGVTWTTPPILAVILNSSEFEQRINSFKEVLVPEVERSLNSKLMATINFENLSLMGDVNGDGKIDLTDTRIIAFYIEDYAKGFDMSEYEFIKKYGDVNGDGRITSMDGRWIGLYNNAKFVRREEFTLQELIENFDNWFKEDEDGIYYVIG